MLAAFLLTATLAMSATPFVVERGTATYEVPLVTRDGEALVPLGSAACETLAGAMEVATHLPFVTLTREGLEIRLCAGLSRASLSDGRTAWLPDAVRVEEGMPALTPRSLLFALRLLGVDSSLDDGNARLRLNLPGPTPPVPSGGAEPQMTMPVPVSATVQAVAKVVQPPPPARAGPYHVVIDPGHGGEDCGARSRWGSCEKTITLDIGMRLRRLLEEKGIKVTMTRNQDSTMALKDRVDLAETVNADLMVSLHVNASQNRGARGVETYVYGQMASDSDIADLVKRENAEVNYVDIIVNDLQQRLHHDASIRVAGSIEENLVRSLRTLGRGKQRVKEAPFYVLARSRCPAVLLELGFITNSGEAQRLKDPSYRQRIAECISRSLLGEVKTDG